MEINWNLVNLFAMQYIHPLEGINHDFMTNHIKTKSMTLSINAVAIQNLDVNVWTWKTESPHRNFLRYVTQLETIRQRPFELTNIEYYLIKS